MTTIQFSPLGLEMIIEALKYKAHSEAGQSQAPDLFSKEDTEEWSLPLWLENVLPPVAH